VTACAFGTQTSPKSDAGIHVFELLTGLHFKDYYSQEALHLPSEWKTMQAGMGVRQYKNLVETVVLCPALLCVKQYRCVRAI
jgi:hypothetical protein